MVSWLEPLRRIRTGRHASVWGVGRWVTLSRHFRPQNLQPKLRTGSLKRAPQVFARSILLRLFGYGCRLKGYTAGVTLGSRSSASSDRAPKQLPSVAPQTTQEPSITKARGSLAALSLQP